MAEHDTPSAAEIQEYLEGMKYPAHTADLRKQAKENGAEDDPRVMEFFEHMPDKEFESVTDVSKELKNYKMEQDEDQTTT
jgi:hypothetical protein